MSRKKVRLDELLVARNLVSHTDAALRAVLAHTVKVDGSYAQSAAMRVSPTAKIEVAPTKRFVSRGGYKLLGALEAFDLDVAGKRCIDVGASTGGFTDCLLQAGAQSVVCVDVGYGDLAWKLRQDERVVVFERTNIRTADLAALGAPFDLAVADVSFIGLARLANIFARLVNPGGVFIGLIKPQFEAAHDETNRGFVESAEVRARTVDEVQDALEGAGFAIRGVVESPLVGAKAHNVEYLVQAIKRDLHQN